MVTYVNISTDDTHPQNIDAEKVCLFYVSRQAPNSLVISEGEELDNISSKNIDLDAVVHKLNSAGANLVSFPVRDFDRKNTEYPGFISPAAINAISVGGTENKNGYLSVLVSVAGYAEMPTFLSSAEVKVLVDAVKQASPKLLEVGNDLGFAKQYPPSAVYINPDKVRGVEVYDSEVRLRFKTLGGTYEVNTLVLNKQILAEANASSDPDALFKIQAAAPARQKSAGETLAKAIADANSSLTYLPGMHPTYIAPDSLEEGPTGGGARLFQNNSTLNGQVMYGLYLIFNTRARVRKDDLYSDTLTVYFNTTADRQQALDNLGVEVKGTVLTRKKSGIKIVK